MTIGTKASSRKRGNQDIINLLDASKSDYNHDATTLKQHSIDRSEFGTHSNLAPQSGMFMHMNSTDQNFNRKKVSPTYRLHTQLDQSSCQNIETKVEDALNKTTDVISSTNNWQTSNMSPNETVRVKPALSIGPSFEPQKESDNRKRKYAYLQ